MKKILFLILLITMNITGYTQPSCAVSSFRTGLVYSGLKHYDHSAGITMQSVDQGFGVRYSQYFITELGFYSAFAKGNYDVYGTYHEVPHYKFSLGLQYRIDMVNKVKMFFVAGANNHQFWNSKRIDVYNGKINPEENVYRYKHWSCETGMGAEVGRVLCGFRYDFIREESNVDVGFNF